MNTKAREVHIKVCMGTSAIAAGSREVLAHFKSELEKAGVEASIQAECHRVGCLGLCVRDVLVDVVIDGRKVSYEYVKPSMVPRIVEEHIIGGRPVEDFTGKKDFEDFYKKQVKVVLSSAGRIDLEDMDCYMEFGGYEAVRKALTEMAPHEVIEVIKKSGLRGRGGAGFPTGVKWELAHKAKGYKKYIICNADEGDPGAFMDRSVLEDNPHSVIEGMLIAAYAVGATDGYIYVRAEYPLAIKRLKIAIPQAEERGFLGKNILGSGLDFDIKLKIGAGAFVCGEETALIASIEGERGMPRAKPPFPVESGLWGRPTVINNVETLANVPQIIVKGADWFSSFGTEKSKGTKVFALTGKVKNAGLIEVPMGITMREIIYEIGGGIEGGKALKAVQTGGPSGGCVPASEIDVQVDYENLTKLGAIVGSGGMIALDEDDCMVGVARYFLNFTQSESCGKCVPCRVGTKRLLEILERITKGEGRAGDIELLEKLSNDIKKTSLCGLGQTAPNPVLSTLKYFRDEYEAHIFEKRCPAKACRDLITFSINEVFCTGCGACLRVCPASAITGEKKMPHRLDAALCIKCGGCFDVCKSAAVVKR